MVSNQRKHKLPFNEFLKAVKGLPFNQTEWFYTAYGYDIEISQIDTAIFSSDQNYIVLLDCEIIKEADQDALYFGNIETGNMPAFIFFRCVLPDIILQNCTVKAWFFHESTAGNITIEKNSLGGTISVEGSEVKNILVTDKSECGYIWVGLHSKAGYIIHDNGSQSEFIELLIDSACDSIIIDDKSKTGKIRIDENCRIANLSVNNYSSVGNVTVNGSATEYISITDNSDCGDISIYENSYAWDILIMEGSKVKNLSLTEQSRCNEIVIESNSQIEGLSIEEGSRSGDVWIKESRVGRINIIKNHFSIYLFSSVLPFIRLDNCLIHELSWNAGMKGELYMDGGMLNYLKLYKTAILKDSVFSLNRVRIFIVQLQELLVHGQLIFRSIGSSLKPFDINSQAQVETLVTSKKLPLDQSFWSLIDSQAQLSKADRKKYKADLSMFRGRYKGAEEALFCIVDSSLGKTEITGCDLLNFHFEYRDSKLLESFFSGTKLPRENIEIYKDDPQSGVPLINYFSQKVSIYNQLKKIFDNQGDLVESTWYHAKAMDYQEKLLKEDFKQNGRWLNEQWFDVARFWLNKVTNNHGESWRLALRFILLISFVTYSLYYLALHYKESPSFKAADRFFSNYLLFLDPTHKIDYHVSKNEMWFLPVFFDFASRILIAYGIYQFVAAFRKHSRKSA